MSDSNARPYATGVTGLDVLLGGGFWNPDSHGLLLLIKGAPGVGKTTLAVQIAMASVDWNNLNGMRSCYWTVEQRKEDIQEKVRKFIEADLKKTGSSQGEITKSQEAVLTRLDVLGRADFVGISDDKHEPFRLERPVVEACLSLCRRLNEQKAKSRVFGWMA